MDDLDLTVVNMSSDELRDEYINLKTQNVSLTKRIEDYEQQLYEVKRQLTTSKHMEEELAAELESIQNEDISESSKLSKKISSLEEEILHLKQANADNVQQYETELKEKEAQITSMNEKLMNELKEIEESNKSEVIQKLNDEIFELKSKIEALVFEIEEHQLRNEDITNHNMILENRLTDISSNLEEMKEFLGIKREELEASNERYNNLQDELMVTQMELDRFKNIPQEKAKKGNSLFAEVEDNRQQLKKYINTMNKKFSDMKASYNRKSSELQELHSAYAVLKNAMEEKNNSEDDQARIIESYEKSVEKMKENVDALQKELILRKETTERILNGKQKCTEALIEISRKEVMELRTQLTNQQFTRITSEKTLYDTRLELKKWKLEALSLRSEVLILKQTVDDLKLRKSIDSPTKMTEKPKGNEAKKVKEEKKVEPAKKIDVLGDIVFDDEKLKKKVDSKYKGTGFWQQRTLTVVENDLLDKSDSEKSDNEKFDNSLSDLDVRKHNIPNLSYTDSVFCNDSFEEFDDLNLKKPLDSCDELKIESKSTKFDEILTKCTEENKENFKVKFNEDKPRKVCFSQDTIETKKVAPRRGKILVPKNTLHISSMKKP